MIDWGFWTWLFGLLCAIGAFLCDVAVLGHDLGLY